ncbi:hypothetical protein [Nocardia nova]|uniref:hypothetical protein n=1 Tax=Nocardia nova TaxID=37330 RepID=UPI0011B05BEC
MSLPSPGGVVQIRRIRSVVSKRGHPGSPVAAKAMKASRIAADRPAKSVPAAATGQPGDDALRTARGLLSLVEGLLLQLARGEIDPGEAATVITRFVTLAFGAGP